jgi:hypothetical protein
MKRVGLGPLTLEGVAEGRYEILKPAAAEEFKRSISRRGKGKEKRDDGDGWKLAKVSSIPGTQSRERKKI